MRGFLAFLGLFVFRDRQEKQGISDSFVSILFLSLIITWDLDALIAGNLKHREEDSQLLLPKGDLSRLVL